MLGVGWTEMLVIGVIALIVIGPKELPAVMRRVGQFAGTLRRMGQDFQRELNKTTGLNEITNLRKSVTEPLKATADAIRKEFNTTMADGKVAPSGAIKPSDPKAESVVDEIRAQAGMSPEPAAAGSTPTPQMQPLKTGPADKDAAKAPVKAKRAPRVAKPREAAVAAEELPAVSEKPAAVKAAPRKSGATSKTAATDRPATTKTAAVKPAATKATAAKGTAAKAPKGAAKPATKSAPAPKADAKPASAKPAAKKPSPKRATAEPRAAATDTASAAGEVAAKPKTTRSRKPAAGKS